MESQTYVKDSNLSQGVSSIEPITSIIPYSGILERNRIRDQKGPVAGMRLNSVNSGGSVAIGATSETDVRLRSGQDCFPLQAEKSRKIKLLE